MWIIQNGHVLSISDGGPLPPGSAPVELPSDFLEYPERYKVEYDKIVPRSKAELKAAAKRKALKLTQDEIQKIKQAIERNAL
jgi:DNA-directed RNA polymerase subunit F